MGRKTKTLNYMANLMTADWNGESKGMSEVPLLNERRKNT